MVSSEQAPTIERLRTAADEAGTAPEDRRFRPDVQGLRAVAVVLVVLFHAHVPGLTGGYVGVDVFFVISGFVITGVLLRERASTGSNSILAFYGRRARRIIPAATLVIITAVIASYIVLGPLSGGQTAGDARWASVFLINVHFSREGTNYLSSLLPPSVLQNYWSLAVEEQFYLVYPAVFLVVAGLWRHRSLRCRLGLTLAIAVAGSLAASVVMTSNDPNSAYFSTVPRIWELALGGLVAVGTAGLRRVPPPLAVVASWLGLGLILVAAFAFTPATSYPGSAVVLPVVGAALVIAGGIVESPYGAEVILRFRPFQWLGLISYSLYLWHWPILTMAAERRGGDSLPVAESLGWVVVSVGLATVTYLVLENPIRHSARLRSKRGLSLALGGCLIASSLAVATVEIHGHALPASSVAGLAGLQTSAGCPPPTTQELAGLRGSGPPASRRITARILVVGDSTACTMLPGLEAVGAPAGVQIENAAVIGCGVVSGRIAPSWVNGQNVNRRTMLCQSRAVAAEAKALRSGRPNLVLWASSWERTDLSIGSGAHQQILTAGSPEWYTVLLHRMAQRVQEFTAAGATVVMLTQPPFVDPGRPSGPTAEDKSFLRLNNLLVTFARHRPHVEVVDLADYVCPSGPPCPLVVDNVGVRGDGTHYTAEGSLWVARWLMPRLGIPSLDHPVNALPTVRMVGVPEGTVLTGSRGLFALLSFNLGVSEVRFDVTSTTGQSLVLGPATFTPEGWVVNWGTGGVPNGAYEVRAVASNKAGQRATSPAIRVEVKN
jgi:peptidoglycan/LPS O-acetylase OafA/YrhL